jgi:hypothetical protein
MCGLTPQKKLWGELKTTGGWLRERTEYGTSRPMCTTSSGARSALHGPERSRPTQPSPVARPSSRAVCQISSARKCE